MSDFKVKTEDMPAVREFYSAADGLDEKEDRLAFSSAANRLSVQFAGIMVTAKSDAERREVLESMAGVLVALSNRPLNTGWISDTTRAVSKLSMAFISAASRDGIVPAAYSTDKLDYLAAMMKSAAKTRHDTYDFLPNLKDGDAIKAQGDEFQKVAAALEQLSAENGGGAAAAEEDTPEARRARRVRFQF